ncbi:MAG: hypothetical protein ACK480_12990 [Planctomycetota bacterium]|jgi:hypothetical protein|nr:hypothetical protein [Planctomycetaceae bacterium]MCE2813312.1 hypothetical protein [Planctomycetaceae bacterium]
MISSKTLPSCYLFGIAVFLALVANRTPSISQSDLPPLPDRSGLNQRGVPEQQGPAAYIPTELQNHGIHIVGASSSSATATHLMTTATLSNGQQQLVIVDPAKLTLAVYHIEASRGDIQLRSVRKIDADFSLEEFNLSEPTPSTIRRNAKFSGGR